MGMEDVMAQHRVCRIKIRYHAVFEGTECFDHLGRFAQHFFSLRAYDENFLGFSVACYHRRFFNDNAFP